MNQNQSFKQAIPHSNWDYTDTWDLLLKASGALQRLISEVREIEKSSRESDNQIREQLKSIQEQIEEAYFSIPPF